MRTIFKTTMRIHFRITTVLKQATVRMILQENSCKWDYLWYNLDRNCERGSRCTYSRKNKPGKYKCITNDIVTDEVIITDERIQHIIDRRGKEFYEKYGDKFINILQEPDFIFKDKENTALVCKELKINNKYVNLVLRLVVSTDNPEYKNSIITAVGESMKRFEQRLRNNEFLYKKE